MYQGRPRGRGPQGAPQPHPANGSSPAAHPTQQQLSGLHLALDLLTRRMHQLIRNYDSWDVTLSLWSYSQLGCHDEAALRALCEAALTLTPRFKPVDCANALVALAYLDYLNAELLRQIVVVSREWGRAAASLRRDRSPPSCPDGCPVLVSVLRLGQMCSAVVIRGLVTCQASAVCRLRYDVVCRVLPRNGCIHYQRGHLGSGLR